jgi:hypothetical protein
MEALEVPFFAIVAFVARDRFSIFALTVASLRETGFSV